MFMKIFKNKEHKILFYVFDDLTADMLGNKNLIQ